LATAATRTELAGRVRSGEYVVDEGAVAQAILSPAARPSAVLVAAQVGRPPVRADERRAGARLRRS
jgi:hypothetical protein